MKKLILIGTGLVTGLIFLSSISVEIKPNQTKAKELTPIHPIHVAERSDATRNTYFPTPHYPRLQRMAHLLGGNEPNGYKEYQKLCSQAIGVPQIGMNIDQSRNTSWCFPYKRHTTTTINGTQVQEIYLKRNHNGESDSRYSPQQYLYFDNDILTIIQE